MKTIEDYFKRVEDVEIENSLIKNRDLFEIYKLPVSSNSQVEIVFSKQNLPIVAKILNKGNISDIKIDSAGHYVFQFNKLKIRSTSKNHNINFLGGEFIKSAEIATLSVLNGNKIRTIKDAGGFFDSEDLLFFKRWKTTFTDTAKCIEEFLFKNYGTKPSDYVTLHDATNSIVTDNVYNLSTPNYDLLCLIKNSLSKSHTKKSCWCPADVWLIKKTPGLYQIYKSVLQLKKNDPNLDKLNKLFRDYFKRGILVPISLKQLTINPKPYIMDFYNRKNIIPEIKAKFAHINLDLNPKSNRIQQEIGVFCFVNKAVKTQNVIRFQIKCYPDRFGICQTEITKLGIGINGNGRGSKVPANIMSNLMAKYSEKAGIKCSRIENINYFGKMFKSFTDENIKDVCRMYSDIYNHHPSTLNILSSKDFCNWEYLKDIIKQIQDENDETSAKHLCSKIQGLRFMYLLIKNKKNLNDILNEMILGALKLGENTLPYVLIS